MKDGVLTPGKNFEQSKEIKLKNFSNELFKKSFGQFEAAPLRAIGQRDHSRRGIRRAGARRQAPGAGKEERSTTAH